MKCILLHESMSLANDSYLEYYVAVICAYISMDLLVNDDSVVCGYDTGFALWLET